MDELLTKASNQVVTFAIRSGISLASTYAIKAVSKFMDNIPKEEKKNLELTRSRLQTKIQIVSPAIDLIHLVAARGNTNLDSTVRLTKQLRLDIDEFESQVQEISDTYLVNSRNTFKTQKDLRDAASKAVETYMKDLLRRIDEAIPLITLSLTTSGANLNATLPKSVSPARLLQASHLLNKADSQFEKDVSKPVRVGPTFQLTLYSIFHNFAQGAVNSEAEIVWREECPKCNVSIWRKPLSQGRVLQDPDSSSSLLVENFYDYEMVLEEDLDDGRYHEDDEVGRVRRLNVALITRLFFSAAGKLLRIGDSTSPVLVVKVVKNTEVLDMSHTDATNDNGHGNSKDQPEGSRANTDRSIFEEDDKSSGRPQTKATPLEAHIETVSAIEWLAFEMIEKEESSDDSDSESEADNSKSGIQEASENTFESSLSLLEYIIRLTALQISDQVSVLESPDERLALFLHDEIEHETDSISINANRGNNPLAFSSPKVSQRPPHMASTPKDDIVSQLNRMQISRKGTQSETTTPQSSPMPGDSQSNAIVTPWELDKRKHGGSLTPIATAKMKSKGTTLRKQLKDLAKNSESSIKAPNSSDK